MKERIEKFLELKSKEINRIAEKYPDEKSLLIDYAELTRYDHEFAEKLIINPDEVINAFENVLTEKGKIPMPDGIEEPRFHARFYNLPKEKGYTVMIRNITSECISRFISVEGLVNKISDVLPKVLIGRFYCNRCNEAHDEPQTSRFLREPLQCKNCRRREFRFSLDDSKWTDIQKLEIQEPLEMLKGGEQARKIEIWLEDDLVDLVTAGDKVIVTGVVRLLPPKLKGPVYFRYLEANTIEGIEKEFEDIIITPEEENEIKKLSKDPNIRSKIINSIAPSIYGYNEVKEAIALQLFGGRQHKKLPDGTVVRADIHLLLIGDPGVAKSRILQYVDQIAPKSIYITGKGTTGAGLTATAERDEFAEGAWTLKAGALVLASGGIVAIDEFDKMSKEDRGAMHEAMEQQCLTSDFELTLSNGEKRKIGLLVDNLIENSANVIRGINCEILQLKRKKLKVLATDFNKIFEIDVDRVSRHLAPPYLIEISLQNGRRVKVTPEHPCWVIRNGTLMTIPAEEIKGGEFFPIPGELPIQGETQFFSHKQTERPHVKKIEIPAHNSPEFCRFLGYHLSDGSYELNRGTKNGINFWNSNPVLMEDYIGLTKNIFGVNPYIQKRENRKAARITSMQLIDFLCEIDPLLLMGGRKKRIPPIIMKSKKEDISQLLRALFDGDGGVFLSQRNGVRIKLTIENREMAEQVQELLCRFGIRATIFEDKKNFLSGNFCAQSEPKGSDSGKKNVYRVDISGQNNLKIFQQKIGFLSSKKRERLEKYLKTRKTFRTQVDLVPDVKDRVLDIAKNLKIGLKKVFGHSHDRIGKNMQKRNLGAYVRLFESRLREVEQVIGGVRKSHSAKELIKIRQDFRISKTEIARGIGVSRKTIRNWENSEIRSIGEYRSALITIFSRMLRTNGSVSELHKLAFGKVSWCRVKNVRKIKNKGIKWVYDVTVEPYHTFISNNMVLHNTISIAKAGIVTKFKANTSVLAASNPKFSRFDSYKPLVEQFDIPPTLLSRFDLIFPIRDVLDRERDIQIADHMLKMHKTGEEMKELEPQIPVELFRKYIAYSRKNIHPVLTDEAAEKIKGFYVNLRGMSRESITATPRQLEAIVRLAEASAKMRLSNTVTVNDTEKAIDLTNFVLMSIAYDQATGGIDIDRIVTDHPRSTREKIRIIEEVIQTIAASSDDGVASFDDIVSDAKSKNVDKFHIEQILNELKTKGVIYEPRHGWYKFAAR